MSQAVTPEELVELWRLIMDPEYTGPIEDHDDGRGLDVIQAMAAILSRSSDAVQVSSQALYLKPHSTQLDPPASGGVQATGTMAITRTILTGGDLQLREGDEVVLAQVSPDGVTVLGPTYELAADVLIPSGTEGPTSVAIRAVRNGFQGNHPEGRAMAFVLRGRATVPVSNTVSPTELRDTVNLNDRFIGTQAGQFLRFTTGPNAGLPPARIASVTQGALPTDPNTATLEASTFAADASAATAEVLELIDLGLSGELETPTTGGRHAELDMIGRERNQGRAAGESDDDYRNRVCNLADTVSPGAVTRAAGGVLDPSGVVFQLVELGVDGALGLFFDEHFFDDPLAFRNMRVFSGSAPDNAFRTIGFLIVVDGTTLPADADARSTLLNSLARAVEAVRGGGVPWSIAIEPPIP